MNRPFQSTLLLALGLTALLALSSCSIVSRYLPGGTAAQSSQSSTSSSADSSSSQSPEEQTLNGTLNMVDNDQKYLVLVTDEGYSRFSFADTDLDLSKLAPGDAVTVTYTGTLEPDSEEVTAQLVSVTKYA